MWPIDGPAVTCCAQNCIANPTIYYFTSGTDGAVPGVGWQGMRGRIEGSAAFGDG